MSKYSDTEEQVENTRSLLKTILIWVLGLLVIVIAIRIGIRVVRNSKKSSELIYNVATIKLVPKKVQHIISVQGIAQGDPQVKVYPQVPGKFAKNAVAEGTNVKKDDVIVYIDRNMVGYKYELAPVKAPIEGVVTKLYYSDKGDAVNPDMPVAEIANEDNVKVVFDLGQDDLLKVHKGQPAQIFFIDDPAISIDGEVYSVPPVIDTDIMAGAVVVKAQNKAKTMKIGMSVNVEILTEEKDSYMVPEQAVLLAEDISYIYLDRGGKAALLKVITGYKKDNLVEITGPLADGDEVVTDGSFKLSEGSKLNTSTSQAVPVSATAVPAKTEK
jgi:multidrug efflux pump subunit AcrA (membrane-fusion protein)